MAGLRPPHVPETLVPVFDAGELTSTWGTGRSSFAARLARPRTVKIGYDAARVLDRYIRVRARHAQAYRPQLWLGINNRVR